MNRKVVFSLFFFIIYISLAGVLFGANAAVSGTVRSANGEPIEFATVYVKEAALGAITDEKGVYYFNLPAGEYEFIFTTSMMLSRRVSEEPLKIKGILACAAARAMTWSPS